MKKQISKDISLHTEFKGLFAIRDDRNGNLVMMDRAEARAIIAGLEELIDETDLSLSLNLTPPDNGS